MNYSTLIYQSFSTKSVWNTDWSIGTLLMSPFSKVQSSSKSFGSILWHLMLSLKGFGFMFPKPCARIGLPFICCCRSLVGDYFVQLWSYIRNLVSNYNYIKNFMLLRCTIQNIVLFTWSPIGPMKELIEAAFRVGFWNKKDTLERVISRAIIKSNKYWHFLSRS